MLIPKCVSSRRENIIKTAQPNIRLESDCNSRKLTFMIEQQTISLSFTFGHNFVQQAEYLPSKPAIQIKLFFEAREGPIDLLPRTGRAKDQHRVLSRPTFYRESSRS